MRLIKRADDHFEIQLSSREKELLRRLLQLYPRIPSTYQPLSKNVSPEQSSQRLLDEALAETRAYNKRQLQSLLTSPQRLVPVQGGWRLSLSGGDMEWLLQVLNDIRVGSWLLLGSPETPLQVLNAQTAPDVWAMEMAGSFQMRLLEMLDA